MTSERQPTIISNSDITTFQRCQKRFYWEVIENLTPHALATPLSVGLFGHKMLENGMLVLQDGGSAEDATLEAGKLLMSAGMDESRVYRHVVAFLHRFVAQGWKVKHVERSAKYPVGDDLLYAFTPDLIFEMTEGVSRGQLGCIDYKFVGQFWTDREVNLFTQGMKYAKYHELDTGEKIRHIAVQMFNTRAAADATGTRLMLTKWVPFTAETLNNIQIENEYMMKFVQPYLERPEDHFFARTNNKMECKLCPFSEDICPMELSGRDIQRSKSRNYKQNTYRQETYGIDPKEVTR